ncbi:MAG: hypothetical protein FJ096_16805 [Deltaproteobacteria bacterium]|nr:hypothetical protein [Deltaproteobacteria bacterium]
MKKQSFEPFEESTWKKTKAEVSTAHGPFRIGGCSSTTLGILDAEGGHEREVDFAVLMTPARLVLTLSGECTKIKVDLDASGELDLGGTSVRWNATTKRWSHGHAETEGLPQGFVATPSGEITKGGAAFEVSAASGGLAFEDLTFEKGRATPVVDGVPHPLASLASLRGADSARALALAGLLNAAGGCQATASGARVTVTSQTGGTRSTLALRATEAEHEELGLEGEATGGADELSVTELKE